MLIDSHYTSKIHKAYFINCKRNWLRRETTFLEQLLSIRRQLFDRLWLYIWNISVANGVINMLDSCYIPVFIDSRVNYSELPNLSLQIECPGFDIWYTRMGYTTYIRLVDGALSCRIVNNYINSDDWTVILVKIVFMPPSNVKPILGTLSKVVYFVEARSNNMKDAAVPDTDFKCMALIFDDIRPNEVCVIHRLQQLEFTFKFS